MANMEYNGLSGLKLHPIQREINLKADFKTSTKMRKSFLRAYLDVHGINIRPLIEVLLEAVKMKSYEDCIGHIKHYVYWFKEYYESMKMYHMEYEVEQAMESGMTFFEACEDYDL